MLDAQECAAIERDRERALAIVNRLRAEATLRRPDALPIPMKTSLSAYAAPVEAPADDDPAPKFWRNVDLALDVLGKILGQGVPPGSDRRDMRLSVKAAAATIKAAISTDKNMLKAR